MCVMQDIRDCPGPQSSLRDLNSIVKEKFNKLRQRIQVSLICHIESKSKQFCLMWCAVVVVFVRIWSRWPESRTERRTGRPFRLRPRASGDRC